MSISVVQSKALDALASPAGNFDNPVTAGNCVVVLLFTWAAGNVTITTSGVTLGGSADNFAQAEAVQSAFSSATAYVGCWVDPACAGGQTAISATVSTGSWGSGGAGMILLELSGVTGSSPVDVTSSSSGTSGTAVTSGTTPATGTAGDMAIGASADSVAVGPGTDATTINPVGRVVRYGDAVAVGGSTGPIVPDPTAFPTPPYAVSSVTA